MMDKNYKRRQMGCSSVLSPRIGLVCCQTTAIILLSSICLMSPSHPLQCDAFMIRSCPMPFGGQHPTLPQEVSLSSVARFSVAPAKSEVSADAIASTRRESKKEPTTSPSGKGFGKKEQNDKSQQQSTSASNSSEDVPASPNQMVVTKAEVERMKQEISQLSSTKCKETLLSIMNDMEGTKEEWLKVETIINSLEDAYTPMLTLDFFNMAMEGDWRFMFSTSNTLKSPAWGVLRVREMKQTVMPGGLGAPRPVQTDGEDTEEENTPSSVKVPIGRVKNEVLWDLSNEQNGIFDCTGKFVVDCSYEINQGARLNVQLEEHILNPIGQTLPKDAPKLVGLLYNSIPLELFDPNNLQIDVTYLDAELKIVRYTGGSGKLEGVRNVFVRL